MIADKIHKKEKTTGVQSAVFFRYVSRLYKTMPRFFLSSLFKLPIAYS